MTHQENGACRTLVLGLGNPILSDDGVGIRVAGAVQSKVNRPDVTVLEAGVGGLDLLDLLIGYDRVIIIDAVQTGEGKPGQVYRLGPDAFQATRHASTPHDVNFATALELGARLGLDLPREIIIFAVEVKDVTSFSEQCTPEVARAVSACVDMVIGELDVTAGTHITSLTNNSR